MEEMEEIEVMEGLKEIGDGQLEEIGELGG